MSRIIDNLNLNLEDSLREALVHSNQFDACVGYFNLRGWSRISDQLDSLRTTPSTKFESPVRILVGMVLSGEQQLRMEIDPVAQAQANRAPDFRSSERLAKEQVRNFAKQLVIGVPTPADLRSIRLLLADLKAGTVKFKFAAREPLHAKLYLCHMASGLTSFRATVGSSNFTPSGLSRNGELNLEESDTQKGTELLEWFTSRWDDVFSIDITQELIDVLENSWAQEPQPSPRLVHLKMAYELSRDVRTGNNLNIPQKLADQIMPWQEQAIRVASRIAINRGIAVVGDVVGLGKTLVGIGIAAAAADSVLIVCPKNLESMWQEHLDEYSVAGRVVPLSMVEKVLPELKPFQLVLVDESHNLRHRTKAWKALQNYIVSANSNVVLLTATMYNAHVEDISTQLELKINATEELGIRPESHIESLGSQDLAVFISKMEGNLSCLKAFSESSHADDWKRLLSQFLVRRTRPYLVQNFAQLDEKGEPYFTFRDGTPFRFPKRRALPLEYPGGPKDPCDRLVSVDNFDAIDRMHFARYQLGKYIADGYKADDAVEEELISDLKRATASSGFIRTTVLKRLTSSPKAFFITVEKMLLRAHILRWALENGKQLPIGTIQDAAYLTAGDTDLELLESDLEIDGTGFTDEEDGSWARNLKTAHWNEKARAAYEALIANTPKGLKWANPNCFNKIILLNDLMDDNATLQAIVDENGAWNPQEDSKLNALIELINGLEPNEKVLVFSEYADSINYVAKHLIPACSDRLVGVVTGANADPTYTARRFSPLANSRSGGLPAGQSELDILLATDVLSEGQNLQDSSIVVNWDLPWTIIKVIQRAGRVDRVGQLANEISLYSFKPHDGLENVLNLVQRLRGRLEQNKEILGGAENIFSDFVDDDVRGLFDGSASLYAHEGEVDFASKAFTIWDNATEVEQKRVQRLADGTFSTKGSTEKSGEILTYAVAEKSDSRVLDLISLREPDGQIRALTQMDALTITATEADELSAPMLEDHFLGVQETFLGSILPQATRPEIRHTGRVYKFLDEALDKFKSDASLQSAISDAMDRLNAFPISAYLRSDLEESIRRARRNQSWLPVLDRIFALNASGELVDETKHDLQSIRIVNSFAWNGAEK